MRNYTIICTEDETQKQVTYTFTSYTEYKAKLDEINGNSGKAQGLVQRIERSAMDKKSTKFHGRGSRGREHRWKVYNRNVDIANGRNVTIDERGTSWIFETYDVIDESKIQVHFYPTKNTWRIAGKKTDDAHRGNMTAFLEWFNKL